MSHKLGLALLVLLTACSQEEEASSVVTSAINGNQTTHIRIKGKASQVFLDSDTLKGFLNASKDDLSGTSSLDFSWVVPSSTNPDLFTFTQGAGTIPSGSFVASSSSATLNVTTTFPINVCIYNQATQETSCGAGTPITFQLSWAADGFATAYEHLNRMETQGPFTTHTIGNTDLRSASVDGTVTGFTISSGIGYLLDTKNQSVSRDITF